MFKFTKEALCLLRSINKNLEEIKTQNEELLEHSRKVSSCVNKHPHGRGGNVLTTGPWNV